MTSPPSKTPPVLIFGSGRSGTTWVQDVLARANHRRTIFEPLLADEVARARPFANQYRPADEDDPALRDFLDDVIDGKVTGLWPTLRVRKNRLYPALEWKRWPRQIKSSLKLHRTAFRRWRAMRPYRDAPPVIKFIRGNLLARWIRRRYDLPSFVVVRHPCAVLASVRARNGYEWSEEARAELLGQYLRQECLVSGPLEPYIEALRAVGSAAEIEAAIWCIENAELLTMPDDDALPVVHYESLVLDRDNDWQRLCRVLGLASVPSADDLEKPSQQANVRMGTRADPVTQLKSWMQKLDNKDLEGVSKLLNLFGVTQYSVDSPLPLTAEEPDLTASHGL